MTFNTMISAAITVWQYGKRQECKWDKDKVSFRKKICLALTQAEQSEWLWSSIP